MTKGVYKRGTETTDIASMGMASLEEHRAIVVVEAAFRWEERTTADHRKNVVKPVSQAANMVNRHHGWLPTPAV